MKIKILGPSCANCLKLEMLVMRTLESLGIRDATVEKVAVAREIERYLTGEPPGLVIDEALVCAGRMPAEAEVRAWLKNARAAEPAGPART